MEPLKQFWLKNKAMLIGLSIGLLIAILFLTIGFFQTLLLILFGGIGAFIGAYEPVRNLIVNWFKSIINNIFNK